MERLQQLLADHQLYHSDFQMDHFITARSGGYTAYGQYKQALRELFKRYRGLKELSVSKDLLTVDIDELGDETTEWKPYEKRRQAIRLREKQMSMDDLLRNIEDTKREFGHFYKQAAVLKDVVGALTPGRRNELDREMWASNMKTMTAIDFLTAHRLSPATVNMLMAIPADMRHEVLSETNKPEVELIAWLEGQSVKALPEGAANAAS